jgi:hypothetical protein
VREIVDARRLHTFMRALGSEARERCRVYLTGGATAVLFGWRGTTIDVDVKIVPEADSVLRALPALKDSLRINVELASPGDFIPELPGWEDRSPFIGAEGDVAFHHYDLVSQALAKIERGHVQDRIDVEAMLSRGLATPALLRERFARIEPLLFRFPALDAASFKRALDEALGDAS